MKLQLSRQIFRKKNPNVKFHKNPSSWIASRGQAGRHDEINSRFSHFLERA